jgi:hypothetical protein
MLLIWVSVEARIHSSLFTQKDSNKNVPSTGLRTKARDCENYQKAKLSGAEKKKEISRFVEVHEKGLKSRRD